MWKCCMRIGRGGEHGIFVRNAKFSAGGTVKSNMGEEAYGFDQPVHDREK